MEATDSGLIAMSNEPSDILTKHPIPGDAVLQTTPPSTVDRMPRLLLLSDCSAEASVSGQRVPVRESDDRELVPH